MFIVEKFVKKAAILAAVLAFASPLAISRTMHAQGPVYCVYAGLNYSVGAQLANGQVCQNDGTWSKVKVQQPGQ